GIQAFDQLTLTLSHSDNRRVDVGCISVEVGELQVILKMPCLRLQQAVIELAEFFVQMRNQHREALTGARLDKGSDYQGIGQAVRLMVAHQFTQARGVTR